MPLTQRAGLFKWLLSVEGHLIHNKETHRDGDTPLKFTEKVRDYQLRGLSFFFFYCPVQWIPI